MNFLKILRLRYFCPLSGIVGRIALFIATGFFPFSLVQAQDTNEPPVIELKLSGYLQQVLQHNESIQAQMLETEVGRRKERGEKGIFEPDFEASYTREGNKRTNDVQQEAEQSDQSFFEEQNSIYDSGLEALIPTGGKIRLGYTLSDLDNNVNPVSSILTSTNNRVCEPARSIFPVIPASGPSITSTGVPGGISSTGARGWSLDMRRWTSARSATRSFWS